LKALSNNIIAIDFGESRLKMVQLSGGKVKKTAYAETPDNIIRDGIIPSMDAMAEFVKETARLNKIPKGNCAVVLPDALAFTKHVTIPVMTEEQLRYNLPFEFRDYTTEEKGRYFYDYAVEGVNADESGEPKELELFACAVLKTTIEEYKTMLRRAGFRLKVAMPEVFAYSSLIRNYQERTGDREAESCIIDIGYKSTRMVFLHEGWYFTQRTFPMGTQDLVRVIADETQVGDHMAGTYLACNYNGILEANSCKEVYNRMAIEIMKAISFYKSSRRESSLDKIYLCGGGAAIQPLVETISEIVVLGLRGAKDLMPGFDAEDAKPWLFAKAVGIGLKT
jgi:type IV pilus assembly protein PilM